MNMTIHATKRRQQRGIQACHIKLITAFGTTEIRPGNAIASYLDDRGMKDLENVLRQGLQLLDKIKGQVVIESDGKIVTCYHQHKRLKN